MSVRFSPSPKDTGPVPFSGIPPSPTWQISGPAFPLGIVFSQHPQPRCLGCPPSTNFAFFPQGDPSLTPGQQCWRLGCPAAAEDGAPGSGPTPWSPRTLRSSRRPRKATGGCGAGLCAGGVRPPGKPRKCRYFSRVPSAFRKCRPRSYPAALAAAGSRRRFAAAHRSAGWGCTVAARAPRLGSRVRPPVCPCPRQCPRAQPGPAAAPRPDRDSWVTKGLSRQRGRPRSPRAAGPPRSGLNAHAPARYLRSRSRSSSTWPLSPGGRPSARPLGSAPRTLLATRTRPGEEGRGGDYHILAYQ